MNPKEIAELVVKELVGSTSVWVFLLLVALVAALGSYFGKYLETKGQNMATREDFDRLQHQLAASTSLVASIQAKIARSDWAAREWTTLRIKKVEELMRLLATVPDEIKEQHAALINGGPMFQGRWLNVVEASALTLLYLPELKPAVDGLQSAINSLQVEYLGWAGNAPTEREARRTHFDLMRLEIGYDKQQMIVSAVEQIQHSAAALLKTMIADRAAMT